MSSLISTANQIAVILCCTEPDDYTATSASFTFNASVPQNCVDVPIISDNIIEGSESFFGNLYTSAPRVTLSPDETEISIVDGDRKC